MLSKPGNYRVRLLLGLAETIALPSLILAVILISTISTWSIYNTYPLFFYIRMVYYQERSLLGLAFSLVYC